MIRQEIKELLIRQPFEPFTIHLTSGDRVKVHDATLAAILKSGIFVAQPNSDRRAIIPFLHISALQIANGRHEADGKRGRRPH